MTGVGAKDVGSGIGAGEARTTRELESIDSTRRIEEHCILKPSVLTYF